MNQALIRMPLRGIARSATLCATLLLASCGGGSDGNSTSGADSNLVITAAMLPQGDADAYRFLTQASFGPSAEDVARVKAIGYDNWIDEQFAMNLQSSHLATVEASAARRQTGSGDVIDVLDSWWTHSVRDPAQLRQRVAFALSEIFVVSTMSVSNSRTVASYLDTLTAHADGRYRDLLEAVTLHPAMGQYLSHLANRKEDTNTGRVPDENYAREVMQLFSIGLYELDDAGKPVLNQGKATETYSAEDVRGLAKVMTGWSWGRTAAQAALQWWHCFWRSSDCQDITQDVKAMSPYPEEHSFSARVVLGASSPAQSTPDPRKDLKDALDRLAAHHNTAPFISRQLIQRLVTSNPSDAYVREVAAVFTSSDGNLRSVVKAILLHQEARHPELLNSNTTGKLREPVLKLAHLLRAVPHASTAYGSTLAAGDLPFYLATDTDSTSTALGQSPMRSPSVFNFFRPGYTPSQTLISAAGLVSPEAQITNETSVLAYANFVSAILRDGWGQWNSDVNKYDIQFETAIWEPLSTQAQAGALIDAVSQRLLGERLADDVRAQALAALESMPVTDLSKQRQRIKAAILLVSVSPSFTVQQ
jgi:uncharacterized protein (DUF1800 family)